MNSLYDATVESSKALPCRHEWLLNLGAAKHEEVVTCTVDQRIPNICRIAGAACCTVIRRHHVFVQNGEEYA